GADPNAKDVSDWTPIHHAAYLSSSKIGNLLIAGKANITALTRMGSQWWHIREMVDLPTDKPRRGPKVFFLEANGIEREVSSEEVEKLTALKCYRNEVLYPPELLKNLWQEPPQMDPFLNEFMQRSKYVMGQYFESPPSLTLGLSRLLAVATKRF